MRVLEALRTLEAAVIECKTRDIDTPEVREALDVLAQLPAELASHRLPRTGLRPIDWREKLRI